MKFVGDLAGVNFHPFESYFNDSPGVIADPTQFQAGSGLAEGSATLSYDLDGNLTSDGTTTYTWNARNQLGAFGATSFAYDAFGRRTQNATGLAFLYDGVNTVQEISGGTVTANLLTGLGVDEVFTRTDSAGIRNFLNDGLGSTLALTDFAGTVQTQYTYEPFGKTTSSGTASTSSFQYTGRENDGMGLYYYRARYYNPTLQRFVSEDPSGIGVLGEDLNLYAYVLNGPTNFVDPAGLYVMKPGVPQPSPEIDALLRCIESKTGIPLVVTATTDSHAASTPHGRGVAVDLRHPGPDDADKILCAAGGCGSGFGLDEAKHPSAKSTGPHIHLQLPKGQRGGRGDLPDPKCPRCTQ